MTIRLDRIEVILIPEAVGLETDRTWVWSIPLPTRRPFREAKFRIDIPSPKPAADPQLMKLIADAFEVQGLGQPSRPRRLSGQSQAPARAQGGFLEHLIVAGRPWSSAQRRGRVESTTTNSFSLSMDNLAISGLDFVAGQSVTVGTGRRG